MPSVFYYLEARQAQGMLLFGSQAGTGCPGKKVYIPILSSMLIYCTKLDFAINFASKGLQIRGKSHFLYMYYRKGCKLVLMNLKKASKFKFWIEKQL